MRDSNLTQAIWLMSLRVVVITILMVLIVLVQCRSLPAGSLSTLSPLYIFIASVYLLTAAYGLTIKLTGRPRPVMYFQVILDPFLVSVLVYLTGGIKSPSTFLYLLVIIVSSQFFYRFGGLLTATLSSSLYGSLLYLQYAGYLVPINPRIVFRMLPDTLVFYNASIHVLSFYLVAFLSNYWSEQVRRSKFELDQSKKDLRDLETFNQDIIQSIDSGLITLDRAGYITSFNSAAEIITGLSRDSVMERPLSAVFPNLELPLEGKHLFPDFRYEREKQNELILSISSSPLKDAEQGIVGHLILFQDITETKAIEAQMNRNRILASVGQLAETMAHEIRNPLASLSGCLQVLASKMEKWELMDIVLRDTEKLDRLLSDFLAYARPQDGRPEIFDVSELVKKWSNMKSRSLCRPENLTVELNGPLNIRMDRGHFEKIFSSLIYDMEATAGRIESIHITGARKNSVSRNKPNPPGGPFVHLKLTYTGQSLRPVVFENQDGAEFRASDLALTIICRLVDFYQGWLFFDLISDGELRGDLFFPYRSDAEMRHEHEKGAKDDPPHFANNREPVRLTMICCGKRDDGPCD